jgi:hypothetical protein
MTIRSADVGAGFTCLLVALVSLAAPYPPLSAQEVVAARATGPIEIDGRLPSSGKWV